VRFGATTKTRHVILDFNMLSEIIIFEEYGIGDNDENRNRFRWRGNR
jgi:hypothetical protein